MVLPVRPPLPLENMAPLVFVALVAVGGAERTPFGSPVDHTCQVVRAGVGVAIQIDGYAPETNSVAGKIRTALEATAVQRRKWLICNGGAEGSRTPDLLIANETLCQLSYDPIPITTFRIGPPGCPIFTPANAHYYAVCTRNSKRFLSEVDLACCRLIWRARRKPSV